MNFKGTYISIYKTSVVIFLIISCLIFTCSNSVKADSLDIKEETDNKIIYLTFDDGPSIMTDKVLDTLKEYDVKATFFLIGNQIENQETVVKRIYNEGHGIGLHTFTHNYKSIYSCNKNFIEEMLKCQNEIYNVVGIKPNIIRFPWGSSKKLNKEFLNMLHKNNFKIYDWNAFMSDGVNYKTSPDKLYREATKTNVTKHPIILLMHCDYVHKNTCIALPRVIEYYKEKGYEFRAITEDMPEYTFPIKSK
ncbi:polysaccharide deacetylase family protein [Clostridium sp.]|uniref:polysaccharide deacetylase family protein n=1 Tax=Clostridium sp. TaxID=1506 RepID=UPI003217C208